MNIKQGERPSTYTTNFEYFLNDFGEAELSIKNGTAVYTGVTFYCSEEADCLTCCFEDSTATPTYNYGISTLV